MAFNPSPQVAVARDAAKALEADMCVIICASKERGTLGYASYGETKRLCGETKRLADHLYKAAMEWFEAYTE